MSSERTIRKLLNSANEDIMDGRYNLAVSRINSALTLLDAAVGCNPVGRTLGPATHRLVPDPDAERGPATRSDT